MLENFQISDFLFQDRVLAQYFRGVESKIHPFYSYCTHCDYNMEWILDPIPENFEPELDPETKNRKSQNFLSLEII